MGIIRARRREEEKGKVVRVWQGQTYFCGESGEGMTGEGF